MVYKCRLFFVCDCSTLTRNIRERRGEKVAINIPSTSTVCTVASVFKFVFLTCLHGVLEADVVVQRHEYFTVCKTLFYEWDELLRIHVCCVQSKCLCL